MRLIKQLTYGLFYLGILLIVGAIIYGVRFYEYPTCLDNIQNQDEKGVDCGGENCIVCELKNASLGVEDIAFLPAGDGRITIISEVENLVGVGAYFEYQLNVSNKFGGILTSEVGTSYIDGNDKKYIVLPGIPYNPEDADKTELTITEIKWDTDRKHSALQLVTNDVETLIEGENVRVVGNVENRSRDIIRTARITAILRNDKGDIVNASALEIQDVGFTGEVPFTIFFPAIEELDLEASLINTKLIIEVTPTL